MPEQYEPRVEFVAKGVVLNDQGKRERVLVESHQTLEYAEKAATRFFLDEGAKFTIVFRAVEIPWTERKALREERDALKEQENANV